jgi:HK97 family phage portal protein
VIRLGWIKRALRIEKRDAVYNLNDRGFWEALTGGTSWNVKGKNALKQATVFTCIRILSDTLSKLPCKLVQEGQGVQQITDHYLVPLIKLRPNPFMSWVSFMACMEAQRNIRGNAYAYIEFASNGRVKGLYPLQSDSVEVWVDDAGIFNSTNKMWYIVTLKNGKRIKLTIFEMLHVKTFTLDGIIGITPIEYLKTIIESGKSAENYINKFYEKGLSIKGLIHYTGTLDQEARKAFLEKFEEMTQGLKNSHGVGMLPIGYQFQPLSLTMADAQFLENTKLTSQQIGAAFGIKMHQLNDLSRATFSNIESQHIEFYSDTIQTPVTAYEQELTYKLILDSEIRSGKSIKFNINAIIRADIVARYNAYRIGIQGSFIKPNEARSLEELPPAAGGDQLYANGNMQKLVDVGAFYKNKGVDQSGQAPTTGAKDGDQAQAV